MFPNRTGRTAGNGPDSHHPKRQESGKSSMWSCMWWIWKNLAWFSSASYTVLCGGSKAWPTWSPVNLIKIRVAFSTLCESLHVSIWKLLGSLPQCSHPLGSPLSPFFFYSSCILITFNHLCPHPSYPQDNFLFFTPSLIILSTSQVWAFAVKNAGSLQRRWGEKA